ncbi:MAG: tetratricopeptide (TPR) repeat protein [Dinoroseobacter sp.]|jgi:tetratricopeptide (TPR) repeat protein
MKPSDDRPITASGVQAHSIDALDFEVPKSADSDSGAASSAIGSPLSGRRGTAMAHDNQTKKRWWHSQFNLMLAVFGLLVLAAVLFVLLTPPPEVNQPDYASIETKTLFPDSQTPWTQSQQAEARSESQAILSSLLESKKSLEQKDVLQWAPERYQYALDLAVQGDELYKQSDFADAVQAYQGALDQMDSLYDLLPAIISTRLGKGELAIKQGKSELAKQRFQQVLELDEGNLRATEGLGRAVKLNQVLQLLSKAADKEKEFAESAKLDVLVSAQSILQQAFAIDQKFQATADAIKRIGTAIVEKRFQLAMSDAYQALFNNRYGSASKEFSNALKIKPGDPTAESALQQSLASNKIASLTSLLQDAKTLEDQEQWASAQSNYQTVLQRDTNQVSAKLGSIRSRARGQLNSQIEKVLSDTLSFGQTEQKDKATKALADARAIKQKGPKLTRQITQLESALADSDASIKVSLLSDSLTQISLQKVGSKVLMLGKFSNRKMALKPGRYIAIGVRLGFRDVRKEIELYPTGDSIQSITVQCDQAITLSTPKGRANG